MRIVMMLIALLSFLMSAAAGLFVIFSFRVFTLPFLVMTSTLFALSARAAFSKCNGPRLHSSVLWVGGFLFLPWAFGAQWKGGEDGEGMSWIFILGLGTLLVLIISIGAATTRKLMSHVRRTNE
jgi:hypothetical protein